MKKKMGLVAVLVMALVFVGCASFWETSSKVSQEVGLIAKKICNFDASASVEAQTAMNFLGVASAVVGSVFLNTTFTAAQATDVFNTIANASTTGACVLETDMQNAMDFFNALSTKYKDVMRAKGTKAPVEVPNLINLAAKLSASKSITK
jgi:hypothetical protein